MESFLILFVAAVVCEGIVEYLVAPWFDLWRSKGGDEIVVQQTLRTFAGMAGVLIAWQLQLKFFEMAFNVYALTPWFDTAVTGIAIGRGSNYIHDLLDHLVNEI